MKKSTIVISACFLVFALWGCRNGAEQNQETEKALEEATQLDSLSTELEKTTQTLETETQDLKDALEAL